MTEGRREEWLAIRPGSTPGAAPLRHVDYRRIGNASGRRVVVALRYELAGLWRISYPWEDGVLFDFPGAIESGVPGAPRLPVDRFEVALPPGARIIDAETSIHAPETVIVPGSHLVPPAEAPHFGETPVAAIPDPAVYQAPHWFPTRALTWSRAVEGDGLRKTVIDVYPVAFRPRDGRIRAVTHLHADLVCDLPEGDAYPRGAVEWESPFVRSVLGAVDLARFH